MAKRMFSKLSALESAAGQQSELTHADKQLLVMLLGRRDALFYPWRWVPAMSNNFHEIVRRQKEYLSGELGLPVKATGKGDWKTASERRQRLIDAGLLSATHSGGQVTSMFLAPKGEAIALALVHWLPTLNESLSILRRLHELANGKPNKPIRESVLWQHPCSGSTKTWAHYTEKMVPLLTAGLVRATSDTVGRIAYSIVPDVQIPEPVSVDQQEEEWANELYTKFFGSETRSLESCEPRNTLEVHIPLPATGWGEEYEGPEQ